MARKTTVPFSHTLLTRNGYRADTVERWTGRVARDFMSFADIIAYGPFSSRKNARPLKGCLAVQTTADSSLSAHLKKLDDPTIYHNVFDFLRAGNRVEFWGWKRKKLPNARYATLVPTFRRLVLSGEDIDIYYHETELTIHTLKD